MISNSKVLGGGANSGTASPATLQASDSTLTISAGGAVESNGINGINLDNSDITLTGGFSFNLTNAATLTLLNGSFIDATLVSNSGGTDPSVSH